MTKGKNRSLSRRRVRRVLKNVNADVGSRCSSARAVKHEYGRGFNRKTFGPVQAG